MRATRAGNAGGAGLVHRPDGHDPVGHAQDAVGPALGRAAALAQDRRLERLEALRQSRRRRRALLRAKGSSGATRAGSVPAFLTPSSTSA